VVQVDGQLKNRSRRHDRYAARRRGIRLRHRAAGRRRLHHDAGVSPGTPARSVWPPRTRCCASDSPASLSSWRTSSCSSPKRVREYMAQLGFRTIQRGRRPGRSAGHHAGAGALEGSPPGPDAGAARARVGVHESGSVLRSSQDHGLDKAARSAVDRHEPGGTWIRRSRSVSRRASATSTARWAPCSGMS